MKYINISKKLLPLSKIMIIRFLVNYTHISTCLCCNSAQAFFFYAALIVTHYDHTKSNINDKSNR